MYLLMTRPRAASERFVAQLPLGTQQVLKTIYSPLLDIRPVSEDIDLIGTSGLIFTSSNGVAVAARATSRRDIPCFCVGQATTSVAQRHGWAATMVGDSAEALIAGLLQMRPKGPLLHLRGESSIGDVAKTLTHLGLTTHEQVIYWQDLLPLTDCAKVVIEGSEPVIVPLFSPRTARHFANLAPQSHSLWLGAMSDAVAKPLVSLAPERIIVARRPDSDAMAAVIEKLVKLAMRVEGNTDAH